ncbi:MAG: glutamine synthetase family protein [Ignavibacteriales bacterium]|nr:glutamine synthetase family protein [Ignavibacteriales bacterium]
MTQTYALTNPLSVLLDKPREQFTREDMLRVIEQKKIERITFHYTALDGKLKELRIPIASRYQAERILADGERVDGSSLFKGMVDTALSDLYVIPVYKTAFLNPFTDNSLDFICRYLTRDGSLAPFALDTILSSAAELFRKNTGMEFYAMGELEFFLLSESNSKIYFAAKQRGYHASGPFMKSGAVLDEMVRHITQITGAVKYAHSEVGYIESTRSDLEEIRGKQGEQLEIEFLPTPVVDAADNLVLARWLIRNVAYRNNCVATFAPKLEEGVAGNGFHIHMEARREGTNIMTSPDGKLSPEARKIIGGLCMYADSLTGFGNTVSSAYLRLVPNQEAPTRICWSDMNRSAMIRVPLGWSSVANLAQRLNPQQKLSFKETEGRQTVELRSPDGSANIHLLLAGITMAAEWGLTHPEAETVAQKLYVSGNIFQDEKLWNRLSALPKSCVESAKLILEKRALYERSGIFPSSVIDYVASLLRAEDDENMNQKLIDLPADDRLHETRKIMHKDLHRH